MSADSLDRAQLLLRRARELFRADPDRLGRVNDIEVRLREPLRVALAGSLKAGKSTLLNALVGQEIAPTDATECTRVVTWFRNGTSPKVTAWFGADSANVLVQRKEGRLTFNLGERTAAEVDRIDVQWPSRSLERTTLIDTPGTSSLSRDVSARTLRMLTPEDRTSGADAVVYLLRTLNTTDTQFLRQIGERVGGETGALGIVGVVARADEVGAGRSDALTSAREVAARYADELERTGLCQAVVPVAGLLALAARTLRESEFAAFRQLAQVSPDDLVLAMLSADRFTRPDIGLPVEPELRMVLARKYGLFGIRMAVELVRGGINDSPALAAELLQRSGLNDLRVVLETHFAQRAHQLKAHSAMTSLQLLVQEDTRPECVALAASVARMLADTHDYQELRLLGKLRSTPTTLDPVLLARVQRILGGFGAEPAARLKLERSAVESEVLNAALAEVSLWRGRAKHPLNNTFTTQLCRAAARSAEGIVDTVRAVAP